MSKLLKLPLQLQVVQLLKVKILIKQILSFRRRMLVGEAKDTRMYIRVVQEWIAIGVRFHTVSRAPALMHWPLMRTYRVEKAIVKLDKVTSKKSKLSVLTV